MYVWECGSGGSLDSHAAQRELQRVESHPQQEWLTYPDSVEVKSAQLNSHDEDTPYFSRVPKHS